MIRLFLSALLCLISLNAVSSVVLDIAELKESECASTPKFYKTVEQLQNGVKITFSYDSITIIQDGSIKDARYFRIEGLPLSHTECLGWLPYTSDQVLVPDSANYTIQLLEDAYTDYKFHLSPARRLPENNFDNPENDLKPIRVIDKYLPQLSSEKGINNTYRGAQLVNVITNPIQYNSATGTARFHHKYSVLIDYGDGCEVPSCPETCRQDPVLNAALTMPNSAESIRRENTRPYYEEKTEYYLILTTDDLVESAKKLSEWRNITGYETRIVSQRKWTKEQVKAAVKSFYETYSPNAKYLTILGDTARVPAYEHRQSSSAVSPLFCSDMDYVLITNNKLADLCYGRIPHNSNDTICAIIEKIIAHDKNNYRGIGSRFVGVAHFQDDGRFNSAEKANGVEDVGFVRPVEVVCQEICNLFKHTERVYSHDEEDSSPAYSWEKGTNPSFPFPANFKDYLFDGWNVKDCMAAVFNRFPNYVIAAEHGYNRGLIYPTFRTEDLAYLSTNLVKYPIVFNFSCETGMYNNGDNFARQLLGLKKSGCASIVAATKETYIINNEYFMLSLMNSIWPLKQFTYYGYGSSFNFGSFGAGAATLGEAMNIANSKLVQYGKSDMLDIKSYHILGDPALRLAFGEETTIIKNMYCIYEDGSIYVNVVPIGYCDIVFYDSGTTPPTLKHFYGNNVSFKTSTPEKTSIYVTKAGLNPYFKSFVSTRPPVVIGPPFGKISSVKAKSPSELEISVDSSEDDLQLRIAESNSMRVQYVTEAVIDSNQASYNIKNSENRLFYITLIRGGEIIDSTTFYNK